MPGPALKFQILDARWLILDRLNPAHAPTGADGAAPRTESAIVVGSTSASPRSELNFIETVFETPRSYIVTP